MRVSLLREALLRAEGELINAAVALKALNGGRCAATAARLAAVEARAALNHDDIEAQRFLGIGGLEP